MPPVILLVEDHPLDADLAQIAIDRCSLPHRIVVARDGVEALDYLERTGKHRDRPPQKPDLVLLDIKLPRLDGLELLRRMRATPALADIPVMMLSASNLEEDRRAATRLGISAYLVKPIDWLGFLKTICESLRLHLC